MTRCIAIRSIVMTLTGRVVTIGFVIAIRQAITRRVGVTLAILFSLFSFLLAPLPIPALLRRSLLLCIVIIIIVIT